MQMESVRFCGKGPGLIIDSSRPGLFRGMDDDLWVFKLFFACLILFLGFVGGAGGVSAVSAAGAVADIGPCNTIDSINTINTPGPGVHELAKNLSDGMCKSKNVKYVEGELLVKFKPGTSKRERSGIHSGMNSMVVREFKSVKGLQLLELPPGEDVKKAMEYYNGRPLVEYAEPNYVVETLATPNDPMFGNLWGMAKINATNAWDLSTGSGNVVVAVIDTGVDYNHEDLNGNMWLNPGENCTDGVDNDGNGYVDDCYGIDTYNGDSDPMDDNGHGTHVSGSFRYHRSDWKQRHRCSGRQLGREHNGREIHGCIQHRLDRRCNPGPGLRPGHEE